MSTSVVCIDTVGSDTATVIIRIQEVTNVRVLPPFSVFPAVAPETTVGFRRCAWDECSGARHGAAAAARVNGAVRARVGSRPAPGCAVHGWAVAAGTRSEGGAACRWARKGAPAPSAGASELR
jgi:hypothetical protein